MENWASVSHLYAWPEPERLRLALAEGAADRVFTTPVVRHDQALKDSMLDAVEVLKGRATPRSAVTQDKEGLKSLIRLGHLKAAFNLTTSLLTAMGHVVNAPIRRSSCTFESFEIWNCRFQLLMALEMHRVLLEEISAFNELDAPDLFFQFRSNYKRLGFTGSIVPFQMRLIHAEAPRFGDDPNRALTRVAFLEANTHSAMETMQSEEHKKLWAKRVEAVRLTKARILYFLKEQRSAVTIYEGLLSSSEDAERRQTLQSLLVRLAMVMGDAKLLDKHTAQGSGGEKLHLHKGMRAVFAGNYQKALDHFAAHADVAGDSAELCNNRAICQLYLGRVKEAVEALLAFDRTPPLPLVLNLYTVGELASTNSGELRTQHFAKHCEQLPDTFDPVQLRVLK